MFPKQTKHENGLKMLFAVHNSFLYKDTHRSLQEQTAEFREHFL